MMLGAMVVFYVISLDGTISRTDGIFLVSCLAGFIGYLLYDAQNNATAQSMIDEMDVDDDDDIDPSSPTDTTLMKTAFLVGGTVGLALGAHFMVDSAVDIARSLGISQIVIGLTIVAIGTSLPELAASMVGAIKSEADLSVGNILGSNLLNVLFVVGTVSIMSPLDVEPSTLTIHFPVMLGICVMLLPIAWTRFEITRLEGGVLLATFLSYMTYIVVWTV